jgi:Fibrinogen beta and gamma chains, C-terminal globular domain
MCSIRKEQKNFARELKLISSSYHYNVIIKQTGNSNTYEILSTRNRYYELRVDLTDFNDTSSYAVYDNFTIDSPENAYSLTSIGTYSGTAGKL